MCQYEQRDLGDEDDRSVVDYIARAREAQQNREQKSDTQLEIEVLPDGLESAYVGEGILCLRCMEGAVQPGEPCDVCGAEDNNEW